MLNLTRRYSHSVLFGGLQKFSQVSAVNLGTGAQVGSQMPYYAPNMFLWSSGRSFSRFYKKNAKRTAAASFRTHTLAEIQELGLDLANGIEDLPASMQARLRAAGVTELFPVQTSTYSLFVDEGTELIVKARTGTGKTLSFLLPLEYLLKHAKPSEAQGNRGNSPVRGIILEPTRELATQVQAQVEKFTALNSCLLYGGGESKQSQYGMLRKNQPEVLVCTPGRLIDVIESYQLDLSAVEYFVLDEGDRMLDMGFQDDIIKIQEHCSNPKLRSMIFSATVPAFIQNIAAESMENPVMVDLVGDGSAQLPAQLKNKAIITNSFPNKIAHIKKFVQENRNKKMLIFCDTKRDVDAFAKQDFAQFQLIHGDFSQGQREYALNKFREPGSRSILVATDVAARGLDIDDIDVVIQMSCREVDSFVHRSGRTARKGKDGMSILFFEMDQLGFVLDVERKLHITIDFANQIADFEREKEGDGPQFGKAFDQLKRQASDPRRRAKLRVDPRDGASIYDALASEGLADDAREDMIQYLIDFFIDKQHYKLDTVGFVTGQLGLTTHGIKNVAGTDAGAVRQMLRDINVVYNQQAMEEDPEKVEMLCDLEHGAEAPLAAKLAAYGYPLERIEVLPNWAKKFLLRSGKNKYAGAARDKYGRPSGYLKREDSGRDSKNNSGRDRGDRRGRPGDRQERREGRDGRDRDASGSKYSDGGFMKGHVAQGRGDRRGDYSEQGRGSRDQRGDRRGPDRDQRDREPRQPRPSRDDRESRFSETF